VLNQAVDAIAFLVGGTAEGDAGVPVKPAPVSAMNHGIQLIGAGDDLQRSLESQLHFAQETATCGGPGRTASESSWMRSDGTVDDAPAADLLH